MQLGTYSQDSDRREHLSRPIGCCRNEANGDWIVCDTYHQSVNAAVRCISLSS